MTLLELHRQSLSHLYSTLQTLSTSPDITHEQLQGLETDLQEHMRIEERILLPALEQVVPLGSLVRNFEGDHHLMRDLLFRLKLKDADSPRDVLRQLHLLFTRHMDQIERRLFPLVISHLPEARQEEVARQMDQAALQNP